MNYDNSWTPEAVEALAEMWKAGATSSQIAACLRRTRNAVTGKVQRMGLRGPNSRKTGPRKLVLKPRAAVILPALSSPPPVKRSIALNHGDNAIRMRLRNPAKPVAPVPRAKRAEPQASPPATIPVDLFALAGCKWPVNDGDPVFLFCNAGREGNSSYCAHHKRQSIGQSWNPFSEEEDRSIRERWDYGRGVEWLCLKLNRRANAIVVHATRGLHLPRAATL